MVRDDACLFRWLLGLEIDHDEATLLHLNPLIDFFQVVLADREILSACRQLSKNALICRDSRLCGLELVLLHVAPEVGIEHRRKPRLEVSPDLKDDGV